MSTVGIEDINMHSSYKLSYLDRLAKKLVLGHLSTLRWGRLIVEDNGEVTSCGEAQTDSELTAYITVHHPTAYRRILLGGSIGAGESYMSGAWSTPSLLNVIRIFCCNLDSLDSMDSSRFSLNKLVAKVLHGMNGNTLSGSKKNIAAHYDLSNDFFKLFLDKSMMYSAAMFPTASSTLEEAAEYKLDVICKKLKLSAEDHLLEIGTGWGGLAIYAARHYGCRVTTTTISQAQYDYAQQAINDAGLEDKITLLMQDYRELKGQYDKLVSVEMVEAVGHENYGTYFSRCCQLLKPQGLMCIQAITIADQRYEQAKKSVDFIQRYIFPGGSLPSNEVLASCISRYTDMQIVHLQDMGMDYGRTLAHWRDRFNKNLNAVKALGFDEVFCRMWEFYLCYCEGGFLERTISTVQVVVAKPLAR